MTDSRHDSSDQFQVRQTRLSPDRWIRLRLPPRPGALQPGEALPSIRPLAEELRVNRNTIAKAYSELENMGVIETLPGKGCFLQQNHSPLRKDVRRKMLIVEIDQAIVQAHHLRVPRHEFLELIQERLDVLDHKRRAHEEGKGD